MHTGPCSWNEVKIPRGHFRGTLVLAAPPEWCPPFAPMRPSIYRGPTHTWMVDEYGRSLGEEYEANESPVLICGAWGRHPGVTGRDQSGQGLSHLSHVFNSFNIGHPKMPGPYEKPPKRGGFLDEYPRWHAALREHTTDHQVPTGVLGSWGPRVDSPRGRPPPCGVAA